MTPAAGSLRSLAALAAGGWSGERLRRYRDERLRALVRHAAREVPLYRRRFAEAGVDPDAFRGLDDLHRLPLLSRHDLQHVPLSERLAGDRAARPMRVYRTSGSSGAPIEIRRTRFEDALLRLLRLRAEVAFGYRPWQRTMAIGRPPKTAPPFWSRLGLLRRSWADCREPVEAIAARLLEVRPRALGGYAGSLAAVAAALDDAARRRLDVRFLRSSAEVLTPAMRRRIEAAFGRPVRDFYAAHEVNLIAVDCPRGERLHVADECVVVEILRDGRPAEVGEPGELVVTGLHSFAVPFIRYRLGDRVTRGPDRCPCGAPRATLAAIEGREVEPFRLARGRLLHPYSLTMVVIHQLSGIERFQFVQESEERIRVQLVALDRAPFADPEAMRRRLESACPDGVRVELEQVAEIRPDATGKHRPYLSRLAARRE